MHDDDWWVLEFHWFLPSLRLSEPGWRPSNRGILSLEDHLAYILKHPYKANFYSGDSWNWRLRNVETNEVIPVEVFL